MILDAIAIQKPPESTLQRVRVLDQCLKEVEDAIERGEAILSGNLAVRWANVLPELQPGMQISKALEAVFAQQAHEFDRREQVVLSQSSDAASRRRLQPSTAKRASQGAAEQASDHFWVLPNEEVVETEISEADARSLTERIKRELQSFSILLLEAHDRRAWDPMGYPTWGAYTRSEFGLSRRRSYELLDHARVGLALKAAVGMSGIPHITPYAAEQIKGQLLEVTAQIRALAIDADPSEAEAIVASVVREARDRAKREQKRNRPSIVASTGIRDEPALIGVGADGGRCVASPRGEKGFDNLVSAIQLLASMPPPDVEVARLFEADPALRSAAMRACRSLDTLVSLWKHRQGDGIMRTDIQSRLGSRIRTRASKLPNASNGNSKINGSTVSV